MKVVTLWHIVIILIVLLVIGIALVSVICINLPSQDTPVAKLEIESARAALSGCIVAVVGVALAGLHKAHEQSV